MQEKTVNQIVEAIENITQCAREHRCKIYITKLDNGDVVYDIGLDGVCTGKIDTINSFSLHTIEEALREKLKKNKTKEYSMRVIPHHWKYSNLESIEIYHWD